MKLFRNHAKKLLSLLCALAILFAAAIPAGAYTNSGWATEEIAEIAAEGLIPSILADADLRKDLTRKEMCYIAVAAYEKLNGKIPDTAERPFKDTTDQVIENAYSVKLVQGMGNGKFDPDGKLSRQQLFTMIFNFLQTTGWKASANTESDLIEFSDVTKVSAWAMEATKNAVGLGLVQGSGHRLYPLDNTSAEEALLMYYRTYTYAKEWKSVQDGSGDIPLNDKYPNTADWAAKDLQEMDSIGMIPTDLIGQSMAAPLTRIETCKTAVLAYEHIIGAKLTPSIESPFNDVDDPAVTVAYQLGIVNGMSDGTFAPNRSITREQFFVMTARFMRAVGFPDEDSPATDLAKFTDGKKVSSYAQANTRLLISLNIVRGAGEKLNPQANTSRQEGLSLFYRAFNYLMNDWEFGDEGEGDNNGSNGGSGDGGNTGNGGNNGGENLPDLKPDPDEVATQKGVDLANLSRKYLGYRYVWGAEHPKDGFDCSGFVYYLYRQMGYTQIRRTATDQWKNNGVEVSKADLAIGDLVFFTTTPGKMTHVGIYIGNGQFIHAANAKTGVIISDLDSAYYSRYYAGAKRIFTR